MGPRILLHRLDNGLTICFWNFLGTFQDMAHFLPGRWYLRLPLLLLRGHSPCPYELGGHFVPLGSFLIFPSVHYHLVVGDRRLVAVGLTQRHSDTCGSPMAGWVRTPY